MTFLHHHGSQQPGNRQQDEIESIRFSRIPPRRHFGVKGGSFVLLELRLDEQEQRTDPQDAADWHTEQQESRTVVTANPARSGLAEVLVEQHFDENGDQRRGEYPTDGDKGENVQVGEFVYVKRRAARKLPNLQEKGACCRQEEILHAYANPSTSRAGLFDASHEENTCKKQSDGQAASCDEMSVVILSTLGCHSEKRHGQDECRRTASDVDIDPQFDTGRR